MLTIFTIPKAFVGHIGVIQRNAISNWLALRPECEIILFGDERGTDSCAQALGVRHIAKVETNEYGTPRLDDVFRQAAEVGRFGLLCYVNADIILPSTFTRCVQRLPFSRFLMVGQRVNVELAEEVDWRDTDGEALLDKLIRESGVLHPAYGSDYFVFPQGALGALPPFVVGRPGWDNWMISQATRLKIPVVDASRCCVVVHQNHDYGHVPGGTFRHEGPEAEYNRGLMGSRNEYMTPRHAGWLLSAERLSKWPWWRRDWRSAIQIFEVAKPNLHALTPVIRRVLRFRDRVLTRLGVSGQPYG